MVPYNLKYIKPTVELLAICANEERRALQGSARSANFIDLWNRGGERRWFTEGVGGGFSGMKGVHRRRCRRCCVVVTSRAFCDSRNRRPLGAGLGLGTYHSVFLHGMTDATGATRLEILCSTVTRFNVP